MKTFNRIKKYLIPNLTIVLVFNCLFVYFLVNTEFIQARLLEEYNYLSKIKIFTIDYNDFYFFVLLVLIGLFLLSSVIIGVPSLLEEAKNLRGVKQTKRKFKKMKKMKYMKQMVSK